MKIGDVVYIKGQYPKVKYRITEFDDDGYAELETMLTEEEKEKLVQYVEDEYNAMIERLPKCVGFYDVDFIIVDYTCAKLDELIPVEED